MNKYFHKIATFTALVLISSISFPVEVFADIGKKVRPVYAASADKSPSARKHQTLAEEES
jgi:hypothetical protein